MNEKTFNLLGKYAEDVDTGFTNKIVFFEDIITSINSQSYKKILNDCVELTKDMKNKYQILKIEITLLEDLLNRKENKTFTKENIILINSSENDEMKKMIDFVNEFSLFAQKNAEEVEPHIKDATEIILSNSKYLLELLVLILKFSDKRFNKTKMIKTLYAISKNLPVIKELDLLIQGLELMNDLYNTSYKEINTTDKILLMYEIYLSLAEIWVNTTQNHIEIIKNKSSEGAGY